MATKSKTRIPGLLDAANLERLRSQVTPTAVGTTSPPVIGEHSEVSILRISLALIDDSPYQPRLEIDPILLDELMLSMEALGKVDQPIKVRPTADGRFQLTSGHRRVRAARHLNWTEIDSLIENLDDRAAELSTLINNLGHTDLSDFEKALLFHRAQQQKFAKTQGELAKLFATSQSAVSGCLGMLALPEKFVTLFKAHPSLISRSTSKEIGDLLKEYPANEDIIYAGVVRITNESAQQAGLRSWVMQKIASLASHKTISDGKYVVPNSVGKPTFSLKTDQKKKTITISLMTGNHDVEHLTQIIIERLKQESLEIKQ